MQDPGTECRPARGACDVAETCTAGSKSCPPDEKQRQGAVCRSAEGLCDSEEVCDGSSDACPDDKVKGQGSVCRPSVDNGTCDPAESCSGTSAACPENKLTSFETPCGEGKACDGDGQCVSLNCGATCFPPGGNPCKKYAIDCTQGQACVESGNQASGTQCGSSTNTECNRPDTCDGAGKCQEDLVAKDTACGDATNNACNRRDTCDGKGLCQANLAGVGSACGDSSDTDCTDPDTCDGMGGCKPNHASSTRACEDGLACTTSDRCSGQGACLGGPPPVCEPDLPTCYSYTCSEASGGCEMKVQANKCIIDSKCYDARDEHPDDSCRFCVPSISQTSWSEDPSACKIGSECFAGGAIHPYNGCQFCNGTGPNSWANRQGGSTCNTQCKSFGTCNGGFCQGGTAINENGACMVSTGDSGRCIGGTCDPFVEIEQ